MTDEELVAQFESLRLPFEAWTHRAHVRVANAYLAQNPFDEALSRLRRGIRAYNAHHRVRESPTSGYDETTTRAFLHLIAATRQAYGTVMPARNGDAFCDAHPQLMTRHVLRLFYSPQRRMHPEAKVRFVEPDLAPLPTILNEPQMNADQAGD